MSECTGCGSFTKDSDETKEFSEDDEQNTSAPHTTDSIDNEQKTSAAHTTGSIDDDQFAANIDLRLPRVLFTIPNYGSFLGRELHHLVDVIRNIQSYAKVTGEYPTKLFKSWEALKDTSDPAAFQPLLEEIRVSVHSSLELRELESTNKQSALACLVRLIEGRRASISNPAAHPLPPPQFPKDNSEGILFSSIHPVRIYIQGAEPVTPLPTLDLPSGGSVRDILFFTTNTS
ncbi:Peptide synthetase [Operophtera brumata]|uniref:Peptide synthetase n=1 Tax=Operophtera brumata TaxID=104452 RepID=A0A0L7LPM4_OPEBR|nr:Peptide synthetase [Operophtera brumata]